MYQAYNYTCTGLLTANPKAILHLTQN